MPVSRRRRRGLALVGAGSVLAVTSLAGLPGVAGASSHREAPLIANDPKADNTDVYAFVSPDNPHTVTLISNWVPFEEPNGGPTYYPFADDARYNINVDNNGDGRADITYRWRFHSHYLDPNTFLYATGPVTSLGDPNLNFRQSYKLIEIENGKRTVLVKHGRTAPSFTGPASMPHYGHLHNQAITHVSGGGKTLAGQADDPFFLDLRVFDLLYGTDLSEAGHDTLTGFNVNTIALRVPRHDLALNHSSKRNPVIGVWSTTDRRTTTTRSAGAEKGHGGWVQVSRLGNPLVNEVVVPVKYKDAFNAISPNVDHTIAPVVRKVTHPIVPRLIHSIYGIKAPPTPRNDLVEVFLTGICKACGPIKADLNSQLLNQGVRKKHFVPAEELRLNMRVRPTAKPNRLGVLAGDFAGFPNGRRLTDDVVDIGVQTLEGAAKTGKIVKPLAAGDGVDANDRSFGPHFPYVALPNKGAANTAAAHVAGRSRRAPAAPVSAAVVGIALAAIGVRSLRRAKSG